MTSGWKCSGLKVKDEVAGYGELILLRAVVVSVAVPGAVEAHFGTDLDGAADPVAPHEGVLRVAVDETGALAFFVVEKVAAEAEEVVGRELLLEVVDDGVLGRGAALPAGQAVGAVGVGLRLDGAADGGGFGLIHVPGLGGDVDGLRKFVIPGDVLLLQGVVGGFG